MESKKPSIGQQSWLTVPEAAEELRIPRTRSEEPPASRMPRLGLVRDFGEPGVWARRVGRPPGRRPGARGMRPVELVLDRLEGARQRGGGYQALCPAHDDQEPSLSVA